MLNSETDKKKELFLCIRSFVHSSFKTAEPYSELLISHTLEINHAPNRNFIQRIKAKQYLSISYIQISFLIENPVQPHENELISSKRNKEDKRRHIWGESHDKQIVNNSSDYF